ncbi:MAG: LptF/LptG family permease, partial [Bacteroidales bacterium]|nr:LptF/LptG family permease [Bacteroidales bacterium]
GVVAELLFYASTTFVPMALPLAILLSSLMTFGNLGENYELVAIKAAGISLRRLMLPLIVLSVFISIIAFYFSNNLLPVTNLKFRTILYDVRQQKLSLNIKEGIYYDGIDGYVIRVGDKDNDGKTVRDVIIYDHTAGMGNTTVSLAEWGTMEQADDGRFLVVTLYNGVSYDDKPDRRNPAALPFARIRFEKEVRRFDLAAFALNRTDEEFFKHNYQMFNLKQLEKARDSLNSELVFRHKSFASAMRYNYYFFSRFDTAAIVKSDTSLLFKGDFMNNLGQTEKQQALSTALNSVRGVKSTVEYMRTSFEGQQKLIRRHDIEWHRKFTLSFACFILFFVGAPMGAIIRKGGLGMPLVVSTLLFVLFHIASTTGDKYVRIGVLDPFTGMWMSSALFLPLGIWLTYKAVTDSPLMDTDAWGKLFRKRKIKIGLKAQNS